jgi:hypothetical protein
MVPGPTWVPTTGHTPGTVDDRGGKAHTHHVGDDICALCGVHVDHGGLGHGLSPQSLFCDIEQLGDGLALCPCTGQLLDLALVRVQQGLDLRGGAHEPLDAADPPAPVQVLECIHDKDQVHVVAHVFCGATTSSTDPPGARASMARASALGRGSAMMDSGR